MKRIGGPRCVADVFEAVGPEQDAAKPPRHNNTDIAHVHNLETSHLICLFENENTLANLHRVEDARGSAVLAVVIAVLCMQTSHTTTHK